MKPQCTTSAECLRELARVMEQFGIADPQGAISSRYVKSSGNNLDTAFFPHFFKPTQWSFAIAEVEGKPVFPGDTLYYPSGNSWEPVSFAQAFDTSSWNPPKPKTVMVEMLVEDVEEWSRYCGFNPCHMPSTRLYEACKKALETK